MNLPLKITDHTRKLIDTSREFAASSGDNRVCGGDIVAAILADVRGSIAMAALTTATDAPTKDAKPVSGIRCFAAHERGGPIDVDALAAHAVHQALAIGHSYAGPEHVLLALLDDPFWPSVSACFSRADALKSRLRGEVFAILGRDDPLSSAENNPLR